MRLLRAFLRIVTISVLFSTTCISASADGYKIDELNQLREILVNLVKPESQDDYRDRFEEMTGKLFEHPESIIGLELVTASAMDSRFFSRFGHTMLRFVDNDDDPLNDPVLSFIANVPASGVSIKKGVFGGYPVLPYIDTVSAVWERYTQNEQRALIRYILPTTQKMRVALLRTLFRWSNPFFSTEELNDYKFFSNNCANITGKFLREAGFGILDTGEPSIPIFMDEWLSRSFLLPLPPITVPSQIRLQRKLQKLLKIKDWNAFQIGSAPWPINSVQIIEETFSESEIKIALISFKNIPAKIKRALITKHRIQPGVDKIEEYLSFRRVPEAVYQQCQEADCISSVLKASQRIWTRRQLSRQLNYNRWHYSQFIQANRSASDFESGSMSSISFTEEPRISTSETVRTQLRHFRLLSHQWEANL